MENVHTSYLLKTSLISGIPSAYALYVYQPLGIVPFSILCTSILYWSDPNTLWKRHLDMSVSMSTIALHSAVVAFGNYKSKHYHFPVLAFGCLCYPIGIYFHAKGRHWKSTYIHSLVHLFCNLAALILYYENNESKINSY